MVYRLCALAVAAMLGLATALPLWFAGLLLTAGLLLIVATLSWRERATASERRKPRGTRRSRLPLPKRVPFATLSTRIPLQRSGLSVE